VSIYFADSGPQGREKIMKEKDKNFIRKRGNGKKDGNNCVWILIRDGRPDFG